MFDSAKLRPSAGVLLVCAFALPALHAQSPVTQSSLDDARHEVVVAENDSRKADAEAKTACDEAQAADEQLLREGLRHSTLTQALARAAQVKRGLCDQWKLSSADARSRAAAARLLLREVAAAPAAMQTPAPDVARRPAGGSRLPAKTDLQAIVAQAQEAQERVGKERAASQGVYDTVDRATKAALALSQPTDLLWVDTSQAMQDDAAAARAAAHKAQISANKFIKHALTIKACLISAANDCGTLHAETYEIARTARDEMNDSLDLSKRKRESLAESAAVIEVAGLWNDDAQRAKALRFAKLIEKYPDANAPFAQNAFTLLASNKEKSAAIRMGWDRLYAGGWRQVTLSFSAPIGDRVVSYADGLTGLPKVGIGYQMASVSRAFDSDSLLYAAAAGLRFGYDRRSYYADGPTFPKSATDVRVSPWELSSAVVLHDANTSNAHLIRASWQRTFEDGPTRNRCPAGSTSDISFVDCITGTIGAPKARQAGVLTYQYRYQTEGFAISPTVTYNTRSKVTEIGLPLYLVRSADDEKRPFNAGIRADWISKGKESITGSTKNTWSFGVFVGTSFSLFSRDE